MESKQTNFDIFLDISFWIEFIEPAQVYLSQEHQKSTYTTSEGTKSTGRVLWTDRLVSFAITFGKELDSRCASPYGGKDLDPQKSGSTEIFDYTACPKSINPYNMNIKDFCI